MKNLKFLLFFIFAHITCPVVYAEEGKCGDKVKWEFDGMILTISYEGIDLHQKAAITDYDMKTNLAPWVKKGLGNKIRAIKIGSHISRIGSCAFYNCTEVRSIEIKGASLSSVGWGAFFGCSHLLNIYFPSSVQSIERIAFANCEKLGAVEIPEDCQVADYAFMSCPSITNIIIPNTAHIGEYAFASEVTLNGAKRYALYGGNIQSLPSYITANNCKRYGLSPQSVTEYLENKQDDSKNMASNSQSNENDGNDTALIGTSDVDVDIPESSVQRINTFALIIGNEDYSQSVDNVPCAKADARTFREYCQKTLGIPAQNIMLEENATLNQMKRGLHWIGERADIRKDSGNDVKVVVYYAGHGVPDEGSHDAYLLPVDGYGSDLTTAFSLNDFYCTLGDMSVNNVTVFLDACFSGLLTKGTRGVAIRPKEATLHGDMVVFSAASGDETAQPYESKGHGMFTYFLLKKLQETEGNVNYGQLSEYISSQVRETAITKGKGQTPTTTASGQYEKNWKSLKF